MDKTQQLDLGFLNLSTRLLKGGVAPKYVRRTIAELQDHYADLFEAELKAGLSQEDAEQEALALLGKEDDLAAEVLTKGDLRSWTSRWPWALYGLAPVAASFVLTILFITLSILPAGAMEIIDMENVPAVIPILIESGIFIAINILPLVVATLVCYQVTIRRDPLVWPIIGLSLLCALAVAFQFRLTWPTPELQGSLSVSLGYPLKLETLVRCVASIGFIGLSMAWFQARVARQQPLQG